MPLNIIIGAGEIGSSLHELMPQALLLDYPPHPNAKADVLHIAFPYFDGFIQTVDKYRRFFKANAIVIHSTVPVGTTRQIKKAVHSPCFGKHPNLASHMAKHVKPVGRYNAIAIGSLAGVFNVQQYDEPETTELFKILCTTHYGLQIAWAQEIDRLCSDIGVPFDEYLGFIKGINRGLVDVGMSQFNRSTCTPGEIGGHCVMPNLKLLKRFSPSAFIDIIQKTNSEYIKRTRR